MTGERKIIILSLVIAAAAATAAAFGIFFTGGEGAFLHESVRGVEIEIFGRGLYRHMSSELAIQGIAQDYVTLFLAVPLLLITCCLVRRGSLRALLVHTGVSAYLFVTYLFYLAMATYNFLFLLYVLLTGMTFFTLYLSLTQLFARDVKRHYSVKAPLAAAGTFLMINALLIALLWLSVILPPLIDRTIYPAGLAHYTTMIVQGFDLALLLPASFISGYLMRSGSRSGTVYGSVFIIFLALMMSALVAKIIAIGAAGDPVFPAIAVIPAVLVVDLVFAVSLVRSLPKES